MTGRSEQSAARRIGRYDDIPGRPNSLEGSSLSQLSRRLFAWGESCLISSRWSTASTGTETSLLFCEEAEPEPECAGSRSASYALMALEWWVRIESVGEEEGNDDRG